MDKLTPEQLEAIRKKLSYCWLVHSEEDEDRYQVFDYFLSINTAEDEDDDCYCTDENECHYCLENKSDARWLQEQERQIALRKIEEYYATVKSGRGLVGFQIWLEDWLQQEEEDG